MTTDHGDGPRDGTAEQDGPDEPALDVAETLRLIREQQDRARDATEPDARLLFLAWGIAWLVGYLCLWTSAVHGSAGTGSMAGAQPEPWAFWVFFSLLAAAIAFTIVHTVTRTVGTRGVSARQGTLYGWSWTLGFVSYGFILGGLARAGASEEVIALASNALACAVVGLLYLGGGVAFCENRLYVVGVWILLVAGVATIAGLPLTYLVMGALGGGGFLTMAVVEHVLKVRRRRLAAGAVTAPAVGERAADA